MWAGVQVNFNKLLIVKINFVAWGNKAIVFTSWWSKLLAGDDQWQDAARVGPICKAFAVYH